MGCMKKWNAVKTYVETTAMGKLLIPLAAFVRKPSRESSHELFDVFTHGCRVIKDKFTRRFRPRLGQFYQYRPVPLTHKVSGPEVSDDYPVISIVTPSYNHVDFLEQTIRSVTSQGYPKLEYFIQDGGSTDGSLAILQRLSSELTDWRSKKDDGQTQAINSGFKEVSGDIMAWLNSDDLLNPGALHYVAAYFSRFPDVDVIYSHRIIIDREGREVGRWMLPQHSNHVLVWVDYVPQETLFWRRRLWEKIGSQLDESFKFAMDWDLLLRFEKAGAVIHRVPEFLGAFRVHAAQKSSAQIGTVGMSEMARIRYREHGEHVSRLRIAKEIRGYLFRHWFLDKRFRVSRFFQMFKSGI